MAEECGLNVTETEHVNAVDSHGYDHGVELEMEHWCRRPANHEGMHICSECDKHWK